ncbi:MAG TPA: hypothetical protein VFM54_23465 [Micromonosporaceae bacterium]|nr:hypothetical protein [Micromonosporaceae bacterium]
MEFLVRWAHTMNRRELLRMLGWAATAAVGAPELQNLDEDESERLVRAIQRPSRVDTQVVDHIAAVLWRCRRQDDALGPQSVLDTVLAQRSLVRCLLPDTPAPVRDRLLSVYAILPATPVGCPLTSTTMTPPPATTRLRVRRHMRPATQSWPRSCCAT